MPNVCKVCTAQHGRAADQKLRAGETATSVAAWLTAQGEPISRAAVSRHATSHLALAARPSGPRPVSGEFLTDVRDMVHQDMAAGVLRPSMRDGLTAQKLLDDRSEKFADRELMARIAQVLGQATPVEYIGTKVEYREVPDWEKAIDAEIAGLVSHIDDEAPALLPISTQPDAKPWRER
jgi:hypothetical protein